MQESKQYNNLDCSSNEKHSPCDRNWQPEAVESNNQPEPGCDSTSGAVPKANSTDNIESDEPIDSMGRDAVERSADNDDHKNELVRQYTAYTIKLPADQLSALQSIWLELKQMYGAHSPDKSGMIESAIGSWLKRWESSERDAILKELLEIRKNTRKRQYKKDR